MAGQWCAFAAITTRCGSDHHTMRKSGVKHPVVLVHPKKDLPIGLVRKIYKDAGWKH